MWHSLDLGHRKVINIWKRKGPQQRLQNIALFWLAHVKPVIFLQVDNSAKLQDSLIMQFLSWNALSLGFHLKSLLRLLFLKGTAVIKRRSLISFSAHPAICNFLDFFFFLTTLISIFKHVKTKKKKTLALIVWHLNAASSLSHPGTRPPHAEMSG